MMTLFLAVAVVVVNAQVTQLWVTSTYAKAGTGCTGTFTPAFMDAKTTTSCTPSACFCSPPPIVACRIITCANYTAPAAPPIPGNFVGFTGYGSNTCGDPSIVRAALPGPCTSLGDMSVSATCTGAQLEIDWFIVSGNCISGGSEAICRVPSNSCAPPLDGMCGSFAKDNCGIAPSTTTTTTTPMGGLTTTSSGTTRPASAAFATGAAVLALLVFATAALA